MSPLNNVKLVVPQLIKSSASKHRLGYFSGRPTVSNWTILSLFTSPKALPPSCLFLATISAQTARKASLIPHPISTPTSQINHITTHPLTLPSPQSDFLLPLPLLMKQQPGSILQSSAFAPHYFQCLTIGRFLLVSLF